MWRGITLFKPFSIHLPFFRVFFPDPNSYWTESKNYYLECTMNSEKKTQSRKKTNHIHISKADRKKNFRRWIKRMFNCDVALTETAWKQQRWTKKTHNSHIKPNKWTCVHKFQVSNVIVYYVKWILHIGPNQTISFSLRIDSFGKRSKIIESDRDKEKHNTYKTCSLQPLWHVNVSHTFGTQIMETIFFPRLLSPYFISNRMTR